MLFFFFGMRLLASCLVRALQSFDFSGLKRYHWPASRCFSDRAARRPWSRALVFALPLLAFCSAHRWRRQRGTSTNASLSSYSFVQRRLRRKLHLPHRLNKKNRRLRTCTSFACLSRSSRPSHTGSSSLLSVSDSARHLRNNIAMRLLDEIVQLQ